MSDPIADKVGRKNTRAFIRANPTTVILSRLPELGPDGAGGVTLTGPTTTVPGQEVRIIPQSNGFLRRSIEGEELQTTHVLLGTVDFDVQRGDFFWLNGEKVEVTFIYPRLPYEVKAEAASRG